MNITIAKIRGIPITLSPTIFFTFILMYMFYHENKDVIAWWKVAGFGVCVFISIFLHELGHAFTALKYRMNVVEINFNMLGGLASMIREKQTNKEYFLIILAGPLVSLFLFLFLTSVSLTLFYFDFNQSLVESVWFIGVLNLVILLFNLLPVFPLDGGQLLHTGLKIIFKNSTAKKISIIIFPITALIAIVLAIYLEYWLITFILVVISLPTYFYLKISALQEVEMFLNKDEFLLSDEVTTHIKYILSMKSEINIFSINELQLDGFLIIFNKDGAYLNIVDIYPDMSAEEEEELRQIVVSDPTQKMIFILNDNFLRVFDILK